MLALPVDGKARRLLACKSFTRRGVPIRWKLSIIGRCCRAERRGDPRGQAPIFREATAESGKVTTQLFDESLALKLNRLRIALEWAKRLIKLLLTGTEATLRLLVSRNLALNFNLQRRLRLHALFTLGSRSSGCRRKPRLFGQLGTKTRHARFQRATLLCRSSDSGRGAGNGGVATCTRQLPGPQRGSIRFDGRCKVGAAGGQLLNTGAPLRRSVGGNGLLRGEGDLIEPGLGCGDGGIQSSDSLCTL